MELTKDITRRNFVAGAAAVAAGAGIAGSLAGCAPSGESSSEAAEKTYDPNEGQWIPTKCNMCFNRCGILAHVVDGVVVELKGNEASAIGGGRICGKGASGIMQLYDPNRITKPMKRTNPNKGFDEDPGWEEISWDEAYDTIVEQFKKAAATGPSGLAWCSMVANNQIFGKMASGFQKIFGPCALVASDICGCGIHTTSDMYVGAGNGQPDYQYNKYLIQFGTQAGTATRHGTNMNASLFAEARANGSKLVSFDPHMSHGADAADLWVPIRPGTDAAAALAMQNVIVNELGIFDEEYLKKRTNGPALVDDETGRVLRHAESNKAMFMDADGTAKPYDEATDPVLEGTFTVGGRSYTTGFTKYREHIKTYTPEYQEPITTVPADTIRTIAKEFAEAACIGETIEVEGVTMPYRPVCADLFSGVSRHKHSTLSNIAINLMNVVVGATNSVGGMIGFAPECYGWTDDNDTMSWKIGIWEEDGFIESNKLYVGLPSCIYEDIREKIAAPSDMDPGFMGLARFGCAIDTNFWYINQCNPEYYNNLVTPSKAMFVMACNPIKWWGNHDEMAEMYKQFDFVAGCDIYLNDSSYFYDIIIPEATYLERYDVMPNLFLAHHTPGALGVDWSVDISQPVVPAKDDCPSALEILCEMAWRAGTYSDFLAQMNLIHRVKEEYALSPDEPFNIEAFYDSVFKSLIDEEHNLEWFKTNGVYRYPRKVEEVYIWANDKPGRVPLYNDAFLEAKERVDAVVAEIGIPWESDDWQALPDWKPCCDHEIEDPDYDIMPIYWTNSLNTDTWQTENSWINEQNEIDPRIYGIEINTKTAVGKGLREGDHVRLVTRDGISVEGNITLSEGVHPEVVAVVGGHLGAKSAFIPNSTGKGVPVNHLMSGIDPARFDHTGAAYDQCCRVKIEKITEGEE